MEVTIRELNQQTAQVLACVQAVYPFGTDPMGLDDTEPTFQGAPDFAERVEGLLAGFGSDD